MTTDGVPRAGELVGLCSWLSAAAAMAWIPAAMQPVPVAPQAPFILGALGMALLNGLSIGHRWRRQRRLLSAPQWTVPVAQVVAQSRRAPDRQWLGRGFDWTPVHAERMQRLLRTDAHRPAAGMRRIDAVEPGPRPLFVDACALGSHTLVFGQTGTGKTRLAELLVTSFLARHPDAVVLVVDPKGDRDLRALLARACRATGRPDALVMVHPAFPERSVRFDPLRNFTRASAIATRITALLPATGQGDPFVQFAWRAINRLVEAMVYAGLRPSLASIRRCLEDDAHPLLARVLEAWEARLRVAPAGVRQVVDGMQQGNRGAHGRTRHAVVLEPRLAAAVARYRERAATSPGAREPVIDGLLSLVMHDPVHFSKMIQNVLPLLASLTAGVLGPLLSPDLADASDRRPVFDARKVIDQRRCLYLGLDALTDPVAAAAIGAIVLADLAQVAGHLFNAEPGADRASGDASRAGSGPGSVQAPRIPVLVFVDEAAEVANAPLLQLLNKSRGAGFSICLAAQTVHDFEAKLGSAAAARMLLGNPGNLIALRTTDLETQRFCAGSLAPVSVESIAQSRSTGLRPAFDEDAAASSIGARRDYREAPLFAPEWLGLLPDLHYVARIAGGRTVKGELPRVHAGPAR